MGYGSTLVYGNRIVACIANYECHNRHLSTDEMKDEVITYYETQTKLSNIFLIFSAL